MSEHPRDPARQTSSASRVRLSPPQAMVARLLTLVALLCWLSIARAEPRPLKTPVASLAICLLSPAANPEVAGVVQAVSPVADPTIFARGQFEEIRLERGGRIAWSRRGNAIEPLEGPMAWPLPALRPGERVLLRLRPVGVGEDNFADVELIGASAATLQRSARLRQSLGRDPQAWLKAVLSALDASRTAEALALLYDFNGPSSPELNALRREIHDRACDSAILGPQESAP